MFICNPRLLGRPLKLASRTRVDQCKDVQCSSRLQISGMKPGVHTEHCETTTGFHHGTSKPVAPTHPHPLHSRLPPSHVRRFLGYDSGDCTEYVWPAVCSEDLAETPSIVPLQILYQTYIPNNDILHTQLLCASGTVFEAATAYVIRPWPLPPKQKTSRRIA